MVSSTTSPASDVTIARVHLSGFEVFDSLSLSRAAAAVRCSSRGYDEPFIVEKKVRINIQPSKDLMVYYYQRTRPCKEGMRAIECHILSNLLESEAIV
jgi:hypothetical protein